MFSLWMSKYKGKSDQMSCTFPLSTFSESRSVYEIQRLRVIFKLNCFWLNTKNLCFFFFVQEFEVCLTFHHFKFFNLPHNFSCSAAGCHGADRVSNVLMARVPSQTHIHTWCTAFDFVPSGLISVHIDGHASLYDYIRSLSVLKYCQWSTSAESILTCLW